MANILNKEGKSLDDMLADLGDISVSKSTSKTSESAQASPTIVTPDFSVTPISSENSAFDLSSFSSSLSSSFSKDRIANETIDSAPTLAPTLAQEPTSDLAPTFAPEPKFEPTQTSAPTVEFAPEPTEAPAPAPSNNSLTNASASNNSLTNASASNNSLTNGSASNNSLTNGSAQTAHAQAQIEIPEDINEQVKKLVKINTALAIVAGVSILVALLALLNVI